MILHPLPDVVILGAMRAGTTFLHQALATHPLVARTRTKELQYFTLGWSAGERAYRRQFPIQAPDWIYRAAGRHRPICIDSTPYYLFHPLAPRRARQTMGTSARFIILLREPVERAWSHYRLSLQRGQEHLGLLDAIDAEDDRLHGEDARIAAGDERADAPHQVFSYVARGRYAEQIMRWWSEIPRQQFLIVRSEAMFADLQPTLDQICRFLEIPLWTVPPGPARNALQPARLPDRARALLTERFAGPNAQLRALIGISF